jgi:hypothetical protein
MMFVNGLLLMEHHEYMLLRVGHARACTVAVFDRPFSSRDVVSADYVEIP